MQINSRAIRSDIMRINSRNLRAEIKAAPSNAGSAVGNAEDQIRDQENIDKKLARYVVLNQQLFLILYVLAEISEAANKESNDTAVGLIGYTGGSKKINGVVTLFRQIETVLEGLIGIIDPSSSEDPKDPVTAPTIGKLIDIYKDSKKNQGDSCQQLFDWSIKLYAAGLKDYGPWRGGVKPRAVRSWGALNRGMKRAYLDLTLNEVKTYRSHEEGKASFISAEQEGAQAKGQTNIATVYQIQDDYSQMIGTLKNAIMTLARFK